MLPPVATRSTGPLGLARWDHSTGEEAVLRVFPDLRTARRLALAVARGRFRDQGATARGPLGLGTEFELIRDYEPDDDIRQVNWRATARLGRPMSNQYRLEQDRDLLLLIDAGRLSSAPLGENQMTILDADSTRRLRSRSSPTSWATGPARSRSTTRCARRCRRGARPAATSSGHCSTPSRASDSDYELAFRRAEGSKRALVVVLCDLLEEAAARSLVRAVPVLTRRHAVMVGSPSDPALEQIAKTPPTDALTSARATIANDVLAARARTAAQVRAAGARVLEAPPDRLPATLVAAYLRAKSRAVL